MKSLAKFLACAALLALALPAVADAAPIPSAETFLRFKALAAASICDCCPRTCGGNPLAGCFNNINMPPDAVTCTYKAPDGREVMCVSCMITSAPAEPAFFEKTTSVN